MTQMLAKQLRKHWVKFCVNCMPLYFWYSYMPRAFSTQNVPTGAPARAADWCRQTRSPCATKKWTEQESSAWTTGCAASPSTPGSSSSAWTGQGWTWPMWKCSTFALWMRVDWFIDLSFMPRDLPGPKCAKCINYCRNKGWRNRAIVADDLIRLWTWVVHHLNMSSGYKKLLCLWILRLHTDHNLQHFKISTMGVIYFMNISYNQCM